MNEREMSLKSRINNIAKSKHIAAQVVLQNYMFERFLDRLSKSEYRSKFVIKGGILISALVGLDTRTTMDLDITLRNLPLTEEDIINAINNICSIEVYDGVTFTYISIGPIRKDDEYGGYRLKFNASFGSIVTPLSIDISTGDVITPNPIEYDYPTMFESDDSISLYGYNLETVLAEKLHAIISRGELSTRPRDYYDVYVLTKTHRFNKNVFKQAFIATLEHRDNISLLDKINDTLKQIESSSILEQQWDKYRNTFSYSSNIPFIDTVEAVKSLASLF